MSAQTKAVVTVSEMARMCGLSRARFYQLADAGVFPLPVYCVSTRRPLYHEGAQQTCLEVRRRNCGANGKPVLFYARTGTAVAAKKKIKVTVPSKPETRDGRVAALMEHLAAVGLTTATAAQVEQATAYLFPEGTAGLDPGLVVSRVHSHLKRQISSGKVGK